MTTLKKIYGSSLIILLLLTKSVFSIENEPLDIYHFVSLLEKRILDAEILDIDYSESVYSSESIKNSIEKHKKECGILCYLGVSDKWKVSFYKAKIDSVKNIKRQLIRGYFYEKIDQSYFFIFLKRLMGNSILLSMS